MKPLHLFSILFIGILASCSSVNVYSDYETGTDFTRYKTYAFDKTSIDEVEISDIDKRRILRAIDKELTDKSMTKSQNPDVIISFFTKEREQVDIWQNNWGWGLGWGWGPMWGGPMWGGSQVSSFVEGTLYIDVIEKSSNELKWQGQGVGALNPTSKKKEERINKFVERIFREFPPKK